MVLFPIAGIASFCDLITEAILAHIGEIDQRFIMLASNQCLLSICKWILEEILSKKPAVRENMRNYSMDFKRGVLLIIMESFVLQ